MVLVISKSQLYKGFRGIFKDQLPKLPFFFLTIFFLEKKIILNNYFYLNNNIIISNKSN